MENLQDKFLQGLRNPNDRRADLHVFWNLFSIYFVHTSFEDFIKNIKYLIEQNGKDLNGYHWFTAFHKQFRQVDMYEGWHIKNEDGDIIDSINGHLDSIMYDIISNSGKQHPYLIRQIEDFIEENNL